MAQQTINNNQSGLDVRTALNANFTELYSGLPTPIKLAGMAGNTNQAINANSFIPAISISTISGGPVTLRIGTGPNDDDILEDTVIPQFQLFEIQQYLPNNTTLYFTFTSGEGTLNVRIDLINNYN